MDLHCLLFLTKSCLHRNPEGLLYLDSVITAVATYPFWMAYRVRLATSWISSFDILGDRRHAGDEKREAAIHSKGCMKHSGPSF
jgi:hypothetical protein